MGDQSQAEVIAQVWTHKSLNQDMVRRIKRERETRGTVRKWNLQNVELNGQEETPNIPKFLVWRLLRPLMREWPVRNRNDSRVDKVSLGCPLRNLWGIGKETESKHWILEIWRSVRINLGWRCLCNCHQGIYCRWQAEDFPQKELSDCGTQNNHPPKMSVSYSLGPMNLLYMVKETADMSRLRILRWGSYTGEPSIITKVQSLYESGKECYDRGQRERERLENASLLVLKMEYGKPAKEGKWSLEVEQARKQIVPSDPQEGISSFTTLTCTPWGWIWTFDL